MPEATHCPYCGEERSDDSTRCRSCGRLIAWETPPVVEPSPVAQDIPPSLPIRETPASPERDWLRLVLILTGLIAVAIFVFTQIGLYTIQPIGAVPDGATLLVWRGLNAPFFDSPDGTCLRLTDQVSLLCRGMALASLDTGRIILRLPYQRWAYLQSTSGREFEQ